MRTLLNWQINLKFLFLVVHLVLKLLDFLKKKFDPPFYKIASAEITDLKLINEIAKTKKPVLVSTGMATFKEIDNALRIIKSIIKKFY